MMVLGKPAGPAKVVRTWGVAAVSVVEPPHQLVEPPLGGRINFQRRAGLGDEHPEAAFGLVGWKTHFNEAELAEPVERRENKRATIATKREIAAAVASRASAGLAKPQQGGALVSSERHCSAPWNKMASDTTAMPSATTSVRPGRSKRQQGDPNQ